MDDRNEMTNAQLLEWIDDLERKNAELLDACKYAIETVEYAFQECPITGVAASRCPATLSLLRACIDKAEGH